MPALSLAARHLRPVAVALAALSASAALVAPSAARDSEAPPHASHRWFPCEGWVMFHWLPYDEARLYRLLGIDRSRLRSWLRDDRRHTIAQLARRRGIAPEELALRLVRPWRDEVSPGRFRLLRRRALRTLTQGHLAQHIFFHPLHPACGGGRRAEGLRGRPARGAEAAAGRPLPGPDRAPSRPLAEPRPDGGPPRPALVRGTRRALTGHPARPGAPLPAPAAAHAAPLADHAHPQARRPCSRPGLWAADAAAQVAATLLPVQRAEGGPPTGAHRQRSLMPSRDHGWSARLGGRRSAGTGRSPRS